MKKIKPSPIILIIFLAGMAIISSASSLSINEAMAFPHASLIIESDEEHVNPIELVLGHTNEPSFGKLPGIHDGKHFVEVRLSDDRTALPLQADGETLPATELFVDKYYFKDIASFQNAQSLEDADAIEQNVPLTAVFDQPGLYYDRQNIDEGIYGYTLRGTINYYDLALVPLSPTTKFCTSQEGDTSKFDSSGWTGSYGCPENIKDIFFPPDSHHYPPKDDDGYGNNYDYGNGEGYENPKEQYMSYENKDRQY